MEQNTPTPFFFNLIPIIEKKIFWKIRVFIYKNYIMKKIIRLTESDLTRIVKRVIKENEETNCEGLKNEMETMFYSFKREVQNRKGRIYGHEVLHELNNLLYGPIEKAFDNKCDEQDPDLIIALGNQRKKYLFEYGVELGEIEPYK